jgi:hypothetical protein
MPLIHKRRIWWEPVAGATGYVVYVRPDSKGTESATFSWGNTPGVISKPVVGKADVLIPDEWPEFPARPGLYHIAITSKNELENESDPLLLSGVFSFIAPASPSRGGIENLPMVDSEAGAPYQPPLSRERTIIQRGLEEVRTNKEVEKAYLGARDDKTSAP